MSIDTKQGSKSPHTQAVCVCKADNPLTLTDSVRLFNELYEVKNKFRQKYGILNGGFELLMQVTRVWVKDHRGVTVYGLKGISNCTTTIGITYTMNRLLEKGLVEVVGRGKQSARLFIPSEKVLSEIIIGK